MVHTNKRVDGSSSYETIGQVRRYDMIGEGQYILGLGQLLVEGGRRDENLERADRMIRRAGAVGCRIVVLPECLDLGWTSPSAKELAAPIPGPHSDVLAKAAREAGVYVVAGLTERFGAKVYNAAVLISDAGEILALHRKINILSIAQDLYATGDRLGVVETPLGVIGLTVCADNFPDTLVFAHSLARMGAQLILSPSAWAVAANHDNQRDPYGGMWLDAYTQIAQLYDVYMVGVSNVGAVVGGPWDGQKCIGCSMAIGPGGTQLAKAPYGESADTLVTVNVAPVPRSVTGTAWSEFLRKRGYELP